MMHKAYLVVEGHGETAAAQNLMTRLWKDLLLPATVIWSGTKRGTNMNTQPGILKACELLRSEKDCACALLLRDADDDCPASLGPTIAHWVLEANLPFPVAVVLAHREYEAWFLPCLPDIAGTELRTGLRLRDGVICNKDPESIRGVKEWLTKHLYPDGKAYKPTLDQLELTRRVDFARLREAALPSFGTLVNALHFLADPGTHRVYPPPVHAHLQTNTTHSVKRP